MSASFATSTLARLATRLEDRRRTCHEIATTLNEDAGRALEGIDLSDLLDSEDPDGGTNDVDRARSLHLAHLTTTAAHDADDALRRITAGTYGACDNCGQRISLARLRALPETRLCFPCKSDANRLTARNR